MRSHRGTREGRHPHRGPNLPTRHQDRESFQRNVPFPSMSEQDFARHHAELYAVEENLNDGQHVGSPHFPRGSERAKIHGVYTKSTHQRDRTRNAYKTEFDASIAEYEGLDADEADYYGRTSDGMLPRHHAALLPLARAREEPNYHNATNREKLLTKEYAYHDLEDQRVHWRRADNAYMEHEQVQTDHARHRKYRSYGGENGPLDCYNNSPVHNTKPHSRSRNQGIPPSGTYCARLNTPPEEVDPYIDEY